MHNENKNGQIESPKREWQEPMLMDLQGLGKTLGKTNYSVETTTANVLGPTTSGAGIP